MHLHTSHTFSVHRLLALCALVFAFGIACSDDSTSPDVSTSSACGEGSAVEDGDNTYCVYEETLIIEGFRCAAPFSFRHDFRAFTVCSRTSKLPGTFLDVLEQTGYEVEPLPPGLPGEECARDGASALADDGCNSCACNDGSWVCTERACAPEPVVAGGACSTDGVSALADDACNVCVCADEAWGCTKRACAPVSATPGDVCTDEGATAPSTDGCNTCTCSDGGWSCTEIACTQPETLAVDAGDACDEEGASAPAGDGCNSCTCSGGFWGCTEIGCQSSCSDVLTEGFCDSTSGCVWGECNGLGPCIDYGGACIDDGPRPHQCQDFNDDPISCEAGGCTWIACGEGETCDDLAPFCSPPVVCGQTCDVEGFQAGDRCGPVCDGDTWACTEEFCPSEENCSAIDDRTTCVEQSCSWVECTDDGPDCMGEFAHCTAPVEPGDPCSSAGGPTTNAADGCNTCFCDGTAWSCTEIACE